MTMQKKFMHENLRNPQGFEWRAYRAFCDVHNENEKVLHADGLPMIRLDKLPAIERRWKIEGDIKPMVVAFFQDPTMLCLAYMSRFFVGKDAKPKAYQFTKEFWPVLRKTKINNISWDMLPQNFAATFRWPEPIVDKDNDEIPEIMLAIMPREVAENIRGRPFTEQDGQGSRALYAWWMCNSGSAGFIVQLIPDTTDKIIPDTWNPVGIYQSARGHILPFESMTDFMQEPQVIDLLKSLIYVASGNPDLRCERNRIPQKHNSNQPARAYRDYSAQEYQLVGWNWMKMMEQRRNAAYSKDSWPVEPFPRYQPYGPRENPSYRWIIIDGHERSRRPELLSQDGEGAQP